MSALGLIQQRSRIKAELSRRIGYTNGLHDILRFARVVAYLHGMGPASTALLRSAILEQEPVRGQKYAEGVIDVGRALGLIHKAGTMLTLSDKGYALYAVQQLDDSNETVKALLLHSILVHDGDASLNLLDILADQATTGEEGKALVKRLLRVLELRRLRAEEEISDKFTKDLVLQELSESERRLANAVDLDRKTGPSWSGFQSERSLSAGQRLERFYAHMVNPRRGWLRDLGLVREHARHQYGVTKSGRRLLTAVKEAAYYTDQVFVLPFSDEVSDQLGVNHHVETDDLFWRFVARSFREPEESVGLPTDQYLHLVGRIYPHAKFHLFNEAAIESLYHAMLAQLAVGGEYMERRVFDDLLQASLVKYPDRLYGLRQRHGRSGYVTVKGRVG